MSLDADHVTALLHAAARAGEPLTYAEVLNALGHRFSRPKMRALCSLLGDIDAAECGVGRPELAVLVVRQSDGLPGQGWWLGHTRATGYAAGWDGPAARAEIARLHAAVFEHWRSPG